ncbi:MAG: hypothetical protein ABSF99_06375 [Anaerolineales bacterium]|jgi:hypothetical protein
MDIPSDKYKLYGNRSGPFLAVLQTVSGLVRRLTGFFMLTEEDRSKAGIYSGGEGRD